jgi:hypothetical protein
MSLAKLAKLPSDGIILASVIVCAAFAPSENVEYSAADIGKVHE